MDRVKLELLKALLEEWKKDIVEVSGEGEETMCCGVTGRRMKEVCSEMIDHVEMSLELEAGGAW